MALPGRLKAYDFNDVKGCLGAAAACIAVSLAFFSVAYLIEGVGWLGDETHGWVGWNWLRGSGIAIVLAFVLLWLARNGLKASALRQPRAGPLFGRLDLNASKGQCGLASLSISSVFFFNGIFYRQEAARWYWAGVETATSWMLAESSSWYAASAIMLFIGIALSAIGWTCIVLQWRRLPKIPAP